MDAISNEIAKGDYDVISLQEVSDYGQSDHSLELTIIVIIICRFGVQMTSNIYEELPRKVFHSLIIFIGRYGIYKFMSTKIYKYLYISCSGVMGSGLCILSKYPITMTLFHAWSVNGYVHRVQHGI